MVFGKQIKAKWLQQSQFHSKFLVKFKHTKRIAIDLKLVGWVMNTNENTVVGCVQGPLEDIDKMKRWLKYEGSPKSRIDKCIFKDEKEVQKFDYKDFVVRK
uniref:acylphosphatase n=1 Tax=Clytia hemisphaerica TaxID=252671 RepID=A0A7M5XN21_9CNID|eukprot:TCONS_00029338-protein